MLTKNTLDLILIGLAALAFLSMGGFALLSWQEREPRAARIAAGLAIGMGSSLYLAIYFAIIIKIAILSGIGGALLLFAILCLLPIGNLPPDISTPTARFDERQIMFARHRLHPGSPEYAAYYAEHPEHQAADDRTRARPGLFSPLSKFASPLASASGTASFEITEALHPLVEGEPVTQTHPLTPQQATRYLKGLARHFGALDVGITLLQPYHVYSHIGRGPGGYGKPVELDQRYAIAFTVEMSPDIVGAAPTGPISMESAHQYVEAGKIAVQLAQTIRNLGYPARAHMDANYRVICPPVARDAGLGEIGRIALLITPRHGPRVRLGVVTTNLELIPDEPSRHPAVIDFCNICQKCARNCPSRSIPAGPRQDFDGVPRWRINDQTCFAYWNEIGTDCGICMSVCPFSHPDHPMHNFVRWGIAHSGFFRRFALWMDDLFYGKQPTRKPPPAWLR